MFVRTGAKNIGSLLIFVKKHNVSGTGNIDNQATTSKKRETTPGRSRKSREHPDESTGVFDCLAE